MPRLRNDLLHGRRLPRSELFRKLQAYRIPFAPDDRFPLMVIQLEDDGQSRTIERTAKELQRLVYSFLKHIVSVGVVRGKGESDR